MTRWQPDTCDGFHEGLGCVIDVESWGVNGELPTGVVVRACARHAALAEAHLDNVYASEAKGLAKALPSMPDGEVVVRFKKGSIVIDLPNASLEDRLSLQASLDAKFPAKGRVS